MNILICSDVPAAAQKVAALLEENGLHTADEILEA